ncbi:hypothetical protein B0H19DRAFT_1128101 [Mycena capillaripes]|nr:hypothetical protein B0H19DRAFT_1128101 [Mycena capillaripes]
MGQDALTTHLRRILEISTSIMDSCAVSSSPLNNHLQHNASESTLSLAPSISEKLSNFGLERHAQDSLQRDPSHVPSHPTLPPISLPGPSSIESKLVDLGLNSQAVKELSRIYSLKAGELHQMTQKTLYRACWESASLPKHSALTPLPQLLDNIITAHTLRYTQALQALEQSAMDAISRRQSGAQKPTSVAERRPPFNHEFIPFLQKYFEYNAFPSAADRAEMAKKSMMEPRQIEVWFQNHRRRAKQEGRDVVKLRPADPAPFELCLKSMEEKMEPYLIPDGLRQSVDSEVSEAGSDDEEDDDDDFYNEKTEVIDISDVLNPPAARHAYPLTFRESRDVASTILPTQQFSFPPPVWRRKASTVALERPVITMGELLTTFSVLHIHDARPVKSDPFQIPTTVIPPSAPLPSLIRGKFAPSPVFATTTLNTVPAPRSRQHPFRSPSPYAQPATLAPASPRRKKASGPPRRTPKKRSTNHRGVSPAMSDTSTLRSVSPPSRFSSFNSSVPSRTPSLESIGFSPSRTPSFGSSGFSSRSSSASSSGPTTPTGSPSALPLEIADSAFFDSFDGQYTSPVEAFADTQAQPDKQQQRQFGFARYAS